MVVDAGGRREQVIDPRGKVTAFAYGNFDRLIGVTENAFTGTCPNNPCNIVTEYAYDRAGNRIAIIDANNHTRTFTYDAANQLVEQHDSLNQVTGFAYNAGGRLVGTDDPRGVDDGRHIYRTPGRNGTENTSKRERVP